MRQENQDERGTKAIDTQAFDGLEGRVIRLIGDEEIKKANTKLELIGKIKKDFFAKGSDPRGGDFITSSGKTISELLAENLEREGKVSYMEDWEPRKYEVEAVTDKEGVPTHFVIHQYRTKERASERTIAVNQHRAELADRRLQQTLMQFRFLRLVMKVPNAPSIIKPHNFKIDTNGTLRVAYITRKGYLRHYTPRQIFSWVQMRDKPKPQKRKSSA